MNNEILLYIFIILSWELIKYLLKLFIPESIKFYFTKKTEKLKYWITNRVDYKDITKDILKNNISRSIETALELYKKAYQLHFKALYIDERLTKEKASKAKVEKEFNTLLDEILNFRELVFSNMILAPDFFIHMLHFEIGISDYTLYQYHKRSNPRLQKENYNSYNHSNELDEAGQLLIKKYKINLDLNEVDKLRTSETNKVEKEEKDKIEKRDLRK